MKSMIQKLCLLLLILSLLLGILPVQASTKSHSYIPDDCGETVCACFIQKGDRGGFVKGIIRLLQEQGYVDEKARIRQFTEEIENAVILFQRDNGLPETGTMDDDTLTLLIWGMLPEDLDRAMPVKQNDPATFPDTVYVPTDGGKKRHSNPACSDMYDPRKVSIRNAEKMGYAACKKCERKRERLLHSY